MRLFLKRILLFFIPVVIFLAYTSFIYFNHGLHKIREIETERNYIVGEPYNDAVIRHTKYNKSLEDIKIMAIGSSRVLQFSQDMFVDPFYNMGYTIESIRQITELIERKNLSGKTLIIGIDQWCFNPNWPYRNDSVALAYTYDQLSLAFNKPKMNDLLKGKVYPVLPQQIALVGTGANLALNGILKDGFYYYGKTIHGRLTDNKLLTGADYRFVDTKERIASGRRRFEYADTADERILNDLKRLIELNKARGNHIILFFPPFAPAVNQIMAETGKYGYITDASLKIAAMCRAYDIPFYDHTHLPSSDSQYIDGFHAGQQLYYEILKSFNISRAEMKFVNAFESEHQHIYMKLRMSMFGQY